MAEEKKKKLPIIRTRAQLDMIFDGLYDQGFGYFGSYKAHESKVKRIISDSNKLRVSFSEYELQGLISKSSNYNEIRKICEKFFKQFRPDDRIKELLNKFHLKSDGEADQPSTWSASETDIRNWVKFKRKYNIKGEPYLQYARIYNLDKNILKLWAPEHSSSSFKQLYTLIFGEEPTNNDWDTDTTGRWQDLGKIQIKCFQNGYMDVKGDVDTLKEYYYKYFKKWDNVIIVYKGKIEVREKIDN